jgi:outer membrane protein OmpA-like peptidoglycan-associated protein
MKIRNLLLGAAASLVLVGAASAGYERDGWYIGMEGGLVKVNETQFAVSGIPIKLDNGWGALGTIGHAFKNSNWRIEGELGYRTNDGKQLLSPNCLTACFTVNGDTSLEEWSGMFNALYDFNLNSDRWGMSIGAGIGIDNARFTAVDGHDSNDKVFAAQAIAGITYRLNDHWDLMANYRYLSAAQAELQSSAAAVAQEVDLEKHTVTVGFRYGYNSPVVVPPHVPTCEETNTCVKPPKQFIVFFGFNKCNITAEADAVLSEAASSAKSNGSASVRVVGHTDSSGSNAYNQKLSECRANAVKGNLVGKGVSEASISSSGKGESELMVQTGDGVKEPQNRRATVDLN